MKGEEYTERYEVWGATVNHKFRSPDICDLCGSEGDLMKCEDCGIEVCGDCHRFCDICGQRFCLDCERDARAEGGGTQIIEDENDEAEVHICYECTQKDWKKLI